ncbi:hypothetical protein B0H15DRAFT_858415 [Mycena belliarum]|uniref:F-box domain-containing protein n=1 Tax=Mycena belliarum TaxID=1033014 RepID=A0AAD6TXC1_9AGAR|nr:hypothetical protein B0H15DRAFT_858415 [Mycena belliae]
MAETNGSLPYDLLFMLLNFLIDDKLSLYRATLINWEFNRAASRVLYSHIILSPAFEPNGNMEDPEFGTLLTSASLSHNAPHVHVLRIGGFFSTRFMPPDFEALLVAVTKAFSNLHTVEILPEVALRSDFFTAFLVELRNRTGLVTLRVNCSCVDEESAPILTKLVGLRKLELKSPGRAILQLLPEWLGRLPLLRELHLTSNCGSVTPGVLRSFLPNLPKITAISFGLSYSITDADLFGFLGQLPCLETARLQHYLQFKQSEIEHRMERLRSLTVLHHPVDDPDSADRICAWVVRAISTSPIERIQLCCDEFDDSDSAPRSFDALVEHVSRTHATTLTTLDLGGWLLSASSISFLFNACTKLQEFAAALDTVGFELFTSLLPAVPVHTAVLQVCGPFSVFAADAARIMLSSRALRRLSVNGLRTEVRGVFLLVRSAPIYPCRGPGFRRATVFAS